MGIREQLLEHSTQMNGLVGSYIPFAAAVHIAEARERELEETVSIVVKDREQTIELCEKLLERQAAMIAELRELCVHKEWVLDDCIEAIISKYENIK